MDKILTILKREFNIRVRKKSFLILSILGPVIFAAMIIIPVWLMTSETGQEMKQVLVVDESGRISEIIESEGAIAFIKTPYLPIDQAKEKVLIDGSFGLIHIGKDLRTSTLYCTSKPSLSVEANIRNLLNGKVKTLKIEDLGLTNDQVSFLNSSLNMRTVILGESGGENQVSTEVTSGLAYIASILIYMFIILYSSQVMRGVAEEKNNKIVEVMILSVKPFQLMIGKVLGIAAVGLTQLVLWMVLTGVMARIGISLMSPEAIDPSSIDSLSIANQAIGDSNASKVFSMIASVDVVAILLSFLFYFITGYLLYSALFAAVGSAVGQDSDSQQFTIVVTFPLIIGLMLSGVVLNDPDGIVATWASIIPFTAPIIMMTRLPFGVPVPELIASAIAMIIAFIFTIWVAGRIYRVGILANNSKTNFKTMLKWFLQK